MKMIIRSIFLTFDMQISKISAAVFNPISILHFLDLREFSKEREKAASRGEYQKNKAKNQMDEDMKVLQELV